MTGHPAAARHARRAHVIEPGGGVPGAMARNRCLALVNRSAPAGVD